MSPYTALPEHERVPKGYKVQGLRLQARRGRRFMVKGRVPSTLNPSIIESLTLFYTRYLLSYFQGYYSVKKKGEGQAKEQTSLEKFLTSP
jgi:hypothetical protein